MAKLALTNLNNLQNEQTAVNAINANSSRIITAMNKSLYRDGTAPNQMLSNLDMNSNRIINLPEAISVDEPVTLAQMTAALVEAGDINTGLTDVPVSAAMQPVVAADTLEEARELMGIQFHGVGDGLTDNTNAWVSAVLALPSEGGKIVFGPGTFRFDTLISAGADLDERGSITIEGSGQDNTILYWPNSGGGLTLSLSSDHQSVHVRDLSIVTGKAGGGNGIKVLQGEALGTFAANDFTNITFRGENESIHYWDIGLYTSGLSGVQVYNCLFFGTDSGASAKGIGIKSEGDIPDTQFAIVVNVTSSSFFNTSTGFYYGSYLQGVTISQCNFTNGNIGIGVPDTSIGPDELNVVDSQFNTFGNDQIGIAAVMTDISISNCLFFVDPGHTGISTAAAQNMTVTGNVFKATTPGDGFGVNSEGAWHTIGNNIFQQLNVGVFINTSAQQWTVTGNVFNANTTGVLVGGKIIMISGNLCIGCDTGIGVAHASADAYTNIQSNMYVLNTLDTNPGSTVGTITVGGGSK